MGTGLTAKISSQGPVGGIQSGGFFLPFSTDSTSYVEVATFSTVNVVTMRYLLTATGVDMDVKIVGNISRTGSVTLTLGECTLTPNLAHVFILDTACHSVIVYAKVHSTGTGGLVGGYSGINWNSFRETTYNFEELVVTNAATIGCTRSKATNVFTATITVEDNPVRFRTDGGDPTTTSGHLLQAGDVLKISSMFDVLNFKIIAVSGDAKLAISYAR